MQRLKIKALAMCLALSGLIMTSPQVHAMEMQLNLPHDFNWQDYLELNPRVEPAQRNGYTAESWARFHYHTWGRNARFAYKIELPQNFNWQDYVVLNNGVAQNKPNNMTMQAWAEHHYKTWGRKANLLYSLQVPGDFDFNYYVQEYPAVGTSKPENQTLETWAKYHYVVWGQKVNLKYSLIAFQRQEAEGRAFEVFLNNNAKYQIQNRNDLMIRIKGFGANCFDDNIICLVETDVLWIEMKRTNIGATEVPAREAIMEAYRASVLEGLSLPQYLKRAYAYRLQYNLEPETTPSELTKMLKVEHELLKFQYQTGANWLQNKVQALKGYQRQKHALHVNTLAEQTGLRFSPQDDWNTVMNCLNQYEIEANGNVIKLNVKALTVDNIWGFFFDDKALQQMPEVNSNNLKNALTLLCQTPGISNEAKNALKPAAEFGGWDGALCQKLNTDRFRKRAYRILQTVPAHLVTIGYSDTEEMARAAVAEQLYNALTGRCDTGVFGGLRRLEREWQIIKCDEQEALPAFAFVAGLLDKRVDEHLLKHGNPLPGRHENLATAPHILRQRVKPLFFGEYEYVAHAGCGSPTDAHMQPEEVVRKFFKGGQIQFNNTVQGTVNFEALTVKNLVKMVYDEISNQMMTDYYMSHRMLANLGLKAINDGEGCVFFDMDAPNGKLFTPSCVLILLDQMGWVTIEEAGKAALFAGNAYRGKTLDQWINDL